MKKIIIVISGLFLSGMGFAQTPPTPTQTLTREWGTMMNSLSAFGGAADHVAAAMNALVAENEQLRGYKTKYEACVADFEKCKKVVEEDKRKSGGK